MSAAFTTLGVGAAIVASLMFVLWLVHLATKNASIVDAGWAGGIGILGIVYVLRSDGAACAPGRSRRWAPSGSPPRRSSSRPYRRRAGEGRYVQLRKDWKTNIGAKFLVFFEFQALLSLVLSLPLLIPTLNARPGLTPLEIAGVALWFVAIGGEALADQQLRSFKANPANRGTTCRAGLWNRTRATRITSSNGSSG